MSYLPLYILEGREVKRCEDPVEWDRWMGTAGERQVALDEVDGVAVSTVFLGLNFGHGPQELVLFETKVFGGKYHQQYAQYATLEAAEAGHKTLVAAARGDVEWPEEIGGGESWRGRAFDVG